MERVFIRELAQHLGEQVRRVKQYATDQGLMRSVRPGMGKPLLHWVSPYGAQRIIVHFRTIQGGFWKDGKDYLTFRANHAACQARYRARHNLKPFT